MANRLALTLANAERAEAPSTGRPVPPPVVKHCWYDGPAGRQSALLLRWSKPTPASSWCGHIAVPVRDDAGNWDLVTLRVSAGMLEPLACASLRQCPLPWSELACGSLTVVEVGPVLVDHRERNSSIPEALAAAGLDVRLTDLPVGDYVFGPGLAVERKGPVDLGASIRDGRIFDQAVRLQSAFSQAVLMLEGEPRGIAEDAWRGAVCRLVEDGFTVLHSLDEEDSAAWIIRLAKRARRAGPTTPIHGPRRAPRHPSAQAEAMLSVVPGISATMARSLLAAYGSLAAVTAAAPEGLRGHPGIGQVRAARLAEALHGVYVAPLDREPEPGRPARGERPDRRWILAGPTPGAEVQSFDRRAIALRALRSAADGTQLIDGLTGEVVATATDPDPG